MIANLFGGIIGDVGNMIDGVLDTDENVFNEVFDTLDHIYNTAIHAPGTTLNSEGKIYDVVGNIIDSTGITTGNIFNASGNVFEQTSKIVEGLIGNITQITGTVLNPKIKVMAGLADIIADIVRRLGQTTSSFPTDSNLKPNLTNTGNDIEKLVQNFFATTLPLFNDFIVPAALKTAQTTFTNFTDTIKIKLNGLVDIVSSSDKFGSDFKNSVAQQINKVVDLALNLTKEFKSAALLNETAKSCAIDFRSAVFIFSKVAIPYITECLEDVSPLDTTNFIGKSQVAMKDALAQTKDLVASLQACVQPPLANKTNVTLKENARTCLINVSLS